MSFVIQENIALHDKNWFRTGGAARYFCQPKTGLEFQEALFFAQTHGLEIFVLGQGANVLISDEGFDGLVIQPQNTDYTRLEAISNTMHLVTCGAGLTMDALIEKTLADSLTGLEVFSGIPGTLGGSTFINLHYFIHFLSDFIHKASVIKRSTGEIFMVDAAWFTFGYNQSTLMNHEYYVISVTLKLKKSSDTEVAYAQGRRYEIIRHRNSRYPTANTCGSFFRNFHEDEVSLISNNRKMIFIAFYLDKIGVKGVQEKGGAKVSWQHANMLVNTGTATSQDIIDLARTLQIKVYREFGILPQPECLLIGFKTYPLVTAYELSLLQQSPTLNHSAHQKTT